MPDSICAVFPVHEPTTRKETDKQCWDAFGRKCWWKEGDHCWHDTATNILFPRRNPNYKVFGEKPAMSWHTLHTCQQERWKYVSSFVDVPVDSFWVGERPDACNKPNNFEACAATIIEVDDDDNDDFDRDNY